eukprot:3116899-Prymnesium_polylepis.1
MSLCHTRVHCICRAIATHAHAAGVPHTHTALHTMPWQSGRRRGGAKRHITALRCQPKGKGGHEGRGSSRARSGSREVVVKVQALLQRDG